MDKSPVIPLNIDITLLALPCDIINVIYDNSILPLKKINFDKNGNKISKLKNRNLLEIMKMGITCRIYGRVEVLKKPSKLMLIVAGEISILNMISGHDIVYVNFSHRINSFYFGDYITESKALKNKEIHIDPEPLLSLENIESSDTGHTAFLYDLEIIPVAYKNSKEFIYHEKKNSISGHNINPFIHFNINYSPYQIEFHNSDMGVLDYISKIVGIIGGVIVIIKIIDKLIFAAFIKNN